MIINEVNVNESKINLFAKFNCSILRITYKDRYFNVYGKILDRAGMLVFV